MEVEGPQGVVESLLVTNTQSAKAWTQITCGVMKTEARIIGVATAGVSSVRGCLKPYGGHVINPPATDERERIRILAKHLILVAFYDGPEQLHVGANIYYILYFLLLYIFSLFFTLTTPIEKLIIMINRKIEVCY